MFLVSLRGGAIAFLIGFAIMVFTLGLFSIQFILLFCISFVLHFNMYYDSTQIGVSRYYNPDEGMIGSNYYR